MHACVTVNQSTIGFVPARACTGCDRVIRDVIRKDVDNGVGFVAGGRRWMAAFHTMSFRHPSPIP